MEVLGCAKRKDTMPVKIVVNVCCGGIRLSSEARKRYKELGGELPFFGDTHRDDPTLVAVVEELGKRANSEHSKLKIVEIPEGVEWEIIETDGWGEHVAEVSRKWFPEYDDD